MHRDTGTQTHTYTIISLPQIPTTNQIDSTVSKDEELCLHWTHVETAEVFSPHKHLMHSPGGSTKYERV